MKTDVLIVGAGPVGLTLAGELARYGVAVRIVDKSPHRTDKSKALVLWSRTLELFARAGQARQFLAAGLPAPAANIVVGNKTIVRAEFTTLPSPYKYVVMIPQSETERILEEYLGGRGVKVERETELIDFAHTSTGVTTTVRRADGGSDTIESAWLGACDGAHSTVRHKLGKAFNGEKRLDHWVLADLHFRGYTGPQEVMIAFHASGVLATFPMGDSRYRIIASVGGSAASEAEPAPHADPTLADVQAILDERGPGGITAHDPVWLNWFSINERKVDDYRDGRIFLAGDAAHVHSPAGGQGMNTGIQDAMNLAWKLALVVKGKSPEEPLLPSYNVERSAVAKLLLEATGKATSLAVMKGETTQAIRNHVLSLLFGLHALHEALPRVLSELAVGYRHSPLSVQGTWRKHGPAAGERAPIVEGAPAVGAGDSPRFALFAELGPDASALIAKYPDLLEAAARPPYAPGGLWLVRPDGYVGFSGGSSDFDHAAQYLSRLSRRSAGQ